MTIVVVGAIGWVWPQVRAFGSLKDARPIEEEGEGVRGFEVIPVAKGGGEGGRG
jgi:hypothetical protein